MFKVVAFENFESCIVTVKILSDFVAGRKRDVGSTFRKFHGKEKAFSFLYGKIIKI